MKYKIGDRVKIREDLIIGDYEMECGDKMYFNNNMMKYKGEIATITNVYDDCYCIDLDDDFWNWIDDFFEPINDNDLLNFALKLLNISRDELEERFEKEVLNNEDK